MGSYCKSLQFYSYKAHLSFICTRFRPLTSSRFGGQMLFHRSSEEERAQYGTLWNAPAVVRNRAAPQEDTLRRIFFFRVQVGEVGLT